MSIFVKSAPSLTSISGDFQKETERMSLQVHNSGLIKMFPPPSPRQRRSIIWWCSFSESFLEQIKRIPLRRRIQRTTSPRCYPGDNFMATGIEGDRYRNNRTVLRKYRANNQIKAYFNKLNGFFLCHDVRHEFGFNKARFLGSGTQTKWLNKIERVRKRETDVGRMRC